MTVVLFIYNRPIHTRRVFERIRSAQPAQLFIFADGPGDGVDHSELAAARAATSEVDWPCKVERDYATENMGCGQRIESGIKAVLEHSGEAVFLEDDCLPDATFFAYCQELLERYRNQPEVVMISGYNPLASNSVSGASYDFSRFGSVWGWASWKRAFRTYDRHLACWDDHAIRRHLREVLPDEKAFEYFSAIAHQVRNGLIDTWDYQWTIDRLLQGGLCAVPGRNLIQNIGFGRNASHTGAGSILYLENDSTPLRFPLKHPATVSLNPALDERLLLHRQGFPCADDMHAVVEKLLAAGRNVQAFALLQIAKKRFPGERRFFMLSARALRELGR